MCGIVDVTVFRGVLPFTKILLMLCDSQNHSAGKRVIFGVLHVTGLIVISFYVGNLVCLNCIKYLCSEFSNFWNLNPTDFGR